MAEVRIDAQPRTEFGKGAARRIRRDNRVPAVLYGHGAETRHVSLPGHDLMLALKGGANTLLRLTVDGAEELALPRQVVRDPIRGSYEHLDLVVVRRGEKVTVDIPVTTVGEVVSDGILDIASNTLSVEADATAIPSGVEIDVEAWQVGRQLTAADVILPEGATLITDPETLVINVMAAPTAEALEAELAESEADLGAGAQAAAEPSEPTAGDPAGEGDVVADTDSDSGGPAQPAS